jgi:hypothetical protein
MPRIALPTTSIQILVERAIAIAPSKEMTTLASAPKRFILDSVHCALPDTNLMPLGITIVRRKMLTAAFSDKRKPAWVMFQPECLDICWFHISPVRRSSYIVLICIAGVARYWN